ncbi:MAG: hypothetical protein JWQ10_4010 [Herbaspirillum sp.]|nr:hypothetical protein [Herbaspirillum sp.]
MQRGNTAAKLVVSYCNRQTDWESPTNDICLQLAADLHQSYPDAVRHLISFSRGRAERDWLTNKKATDSYLLFLLQNKGAVALLKETQGMASIKAAVLAKIPSLPRGNIEHMRTWLDMCPTGWEQFEGDEWWPVFMNVRYSDSSQAKYTLNLCWNAKKARTSEEAEVLRHYLVSVEPKFGTHSDSLRRRVVLETAVTLPVLLQRMTELNARLVKVLAT